MPAADSTAAFEVAYRVEFPRVVAALAAFTGDIALAEDLAQDALADALLQWTLDGAPYNPGAWLTAVGKRKAIDFFCRQRFLTAKYALIGGDQQDHSADDWERVLGSVSSEDVDDDRLRLISVASTSGEARPPSAAPSDWAPTEVPTPCRRPSPPATPAPSGPRKPPGKRSSPSTPNSPALRRPRSSS
jgi:hypothetical protein